jgi:hypothetical protein
MSPSRPRSQSALVTDLAISSNCGTPMRGSSERSSSVAAGSVIHTGTLMRRSSASWNT